MTGRELLKKLRTLCYILGILGIIIGIVAITTNIGNTLFQELVKNIKVPENTNVDAKTYAGIYFIVESLFTLFQGWLLGRAVKNGKKTTLLIILLVLSIVSTILEIFHAGWNAILDMESVTNIIVVLIKGFILNQVIKVRRED